jgi:hypothetical protein
MNEIVKFQDFSEKKIAQLSGFGWLGDVFVSEFLNYILKSININHI